MVPGMEGFYHIHALLVPSVGSNASNALRNIITFAVTK